MKANLVLSFCGIAILAGATWYYVASRRPTLEQTAEEYGSLLLNGDAGSVFDLVMPIEARLNSLDHRKVRNIIEGVFRPYLTDAEVVRYEHEYVNDDHLTSRLWLSQDGRRFPLVLHVFKTKEGNKVLLGVTMKAIWEAKLLYGRGKTFSEGNYHRAIIEGLNADSDYLSRLGLQGTMSNDPRATELVTWKVNRDWSERVLANLGSD